MWTYNVRMDAFYTFMTSDTTIFGVTIHNWILTLGGVVIIWGTILVKDL